MIKMTSTRRKKKCTKHEGMKVSFASELEICAVCLRDAKIWIYELNNRFVVGYVLWGLDWIRITRYQGLDKQERNTIIEGVNEELNKNKDNLPRRVEIVEEYMETRKRFTW
jgi:Ni,Fe-hydrogenase I large subunit